MYKVLYHDLLVDLDFVKDFALFYINATKERNLPKGLLYTIYIMATCLAPLKQ